MAPAAKKAKYDSPVDEVISTVRRSYFGKPVDDEYLNFLKSLLENKMAANEGHSILFDYQLFNKFNSNTSYWSKLKAVSKLREQLSSAVDP